MNANGFLTRLANSAIMRDSEQTSVHGSLAALKVRLDSHFNGTILTGRPIKRHFAFGSFTRGTNLPGSMDAKSDIDYMIVFAESNATPQTYINRLRRFAEAKYPRSEIAQSAPTIVLSLRHIRFELVPAIESFLSGPQIPAPASNYADWMETNPNDTNADLTRKNQNNNNLIKPLVRLVKYWNAQNQYPFESFELEKMVINHTPLLISLWNGNLWEWVRSFFEDLSPGWNAPAYKSKAITWAQNLVQYAQSRESAGSPEQAVQFLRKLLPPVGNL